MYVGGRAITLIFIALGILLSACSDNHEGNLPFPSDQLSAVTSEFPAVALVVLPGGNGICTGTWVSPRAVLTASHCLKNRAGMFRVVSSFGTFSTYNKIQHGSGTVDDPNDIALLLFNEDKASRELGQVYDIAGGIAAGDEARLVGFGCNDIYYRSGSGTKRTGTNVVSDITDYLEFRTPLSSLRGIRGIIGPDNRAGSCFGDSGGPALTEAGGTMLVAGVTHAGGDDGEDQVSEYSDVANRSDNRAFLQSASDSYGLDIRGL